LNVLKTESRANSGGNSGSSVLVMPNYQFRVPPTHAYAILTPLQAAIA